MDQMDQKDIFKLLPSGGRVYLIGIKGTGMCALAELLVRAGFAVSGSDCADVFYTDSILRELNIPYHESFDSSHIDSSIDLVIHSAAYSSSNAEVAAAERLGLPLLKYTDALGAWSANFDSSGIAGVHGKTTTTAMAGMLIRGAGLPAQILAGSAVGGFGGRSTLSLGNKYFVAETCEYRRHFLSFHPARIVLTAVESDHQDYFPDYPSIRDAFVEYCRKLPADGELIYCADDPGACEVAAIIKAENRGIHFIPYGFTAEGDFKIEKFEAADERLKIKIASFPGELILRVPGRHSALNAAAALALTSSLVHAEFGGDGWIEDRREAVRKALEIFTGSRRRSEIIGEAGGILFMDDYGHHPTAIKTTLEGLKEFYPRRRLVLSFMSHTYTRTAALLDEFAASFTGMDMLLLHKIYPSARETYSGSVTGETLFQKTKEALQKNGSKTEIFYVDEPLDAAEQMKKILAPGDLFITMGAGDNWKLGRSLYTDFSQGAAV
ncbi:UDP-N-acetylmuramate--L-alanine ligase [Spirochaetia bacterium]|nr:UDP-N-acetylmuramate--L-alanine ligase [Spirochaetia bacterium]